MSLYVPVRLLTLWFNGERQSRWCTGAYLRLVDDDPHGLASFMACGIPETVHPSHQLKPLNRLMVLWGATHLPQFAQVRHQVSPKRGGELRNRQHLSAPDDATSHQLQRII